LIVLFVGFVVAGILSIGIYGFPGDLPYNESQARKYDRRALHLDREADRLAIKGRHASIDSIRAAAADSRALAASLRRPPEHSTIPIATWKTPRDGTGESGRTPALKK